MMQYINRKTGVLMETACTVSGGDWDPVAPVKPAAPKAPAASPADAVSVAPAKPKKKPAAKK